MLHSLTVTTGSLLHRVLLPVPSQTVVSPFPITSLFTLSGCSPPQMVNCWLYLIPVQNISQNYAMLLIYLEIKKVVGLKANIRYNGQGNDKKEPTKKCVSKMLWYWGRISQEYESTSFSLFLCLCLAIQKPSPTWPKTTWPNLSTKNSEIPTLMMCFSPRLSQSRCRVS